MKSSRVFHRIKGSWYCIEYPPFDLTHLEVGVLRARSMLALYRASDRVFYIGPAPSRPYIDIKTDGIYEYPSPTSLKELTGHKPEDLASFLEIEPCDP